MSEHEWSTLSLESVLGPSGYAVLRAFNGQQALERVNTVGPDVIFIDSRLPDMEGVQLCRALRQHPQVSLSAPIVMVANEDLPRQTRLGAMRAGAWDYLRLPTDAEQLLLQLESWLRAKFDADRARDESLLDRSTGLYSMRGLLKRAREVASEAFRYDRPLACIVVAPALEARDEIDAESERFIASMVSVFKSTNRMSDAVGRLGPDEFVLLAPDTDLDGARRLAERLREALDAFDSEHVPGGITATRPLRVRIGCYAVPNFRDAAIEPVEMLTRATLALRHSAGGRPPEGGIFFYGQGDTPLVN